MQDSDKLKLIERLGGWERLVVFSGVILTVPLFALLATGIYAVAVDRPSAGVGVFLTIICLLVLWAIVWGLLWIITGFRAGGFPLAASEISHEELLAENARLKEELAELKRSLPRGL